MNATDLQDPRSFLPNLSLYLLIYFVVLIGGGFLNVLHVCALLRCRRSGALNLVLQLAISDVLALCVAIQEILAFHHKSWVFSPDSCPVFKGFDILLNNLNMYLIICFNFHVICLWNLFEKNLKKTRKNPLTSTEEAECLMKDSTNRLVTVDYTRKKTDVSTLFPTIFLWIVSISLSIPNFTLSSTFKVKKNQIFCAITEHRYKFLLSYSFLSFEITIPALFLLFSVFLLVVKLSQTRPREIDATLMKKKLEMRRLVTFALTLTNFCFFLSFPRRIFNFIHFGMTENFLNDAAIVDKYFSDSNHIKLVSLAMLHYGNGVVRALLYPVILPQFCSLIRSKIFVCCGSKKTSKK